MLRAFLNLSLILAFSTSLLADHCATYSEARELAFGAERERAISILECRRENNPADLDSLVLLSDLYWWQDNTARSIEIAKYYLKASQHFGLNSTKIRLSDRVSRFSFSSDVSRVFANRRGSLEVNSLLDFRYWKKNHLSFRFIRDSRFFESGQRLTDEIFGISSTAVFAPQFYLEKELSHSIDSEFSPDWKIRLAPHYVLSSGEDIYLGSSYSFYESSRVFSLYTGVIIPVADELSWGLRADATIHPAQALSFQQDIKWILHKRLELRWIIAGGKTDEGNAQLAGFLNVAAIFKFHMNTNFRLLINASRYRGDIRDENRIGGGFEFVF